MAAKTFAIRFDQIAAGTQWCNLVDGGGAPGAGSNPGGWTVGTTAAGNFSRMDSNATRLATTFGATQQPNGAPDPTLGDSLRSTALLKGSFEAGDWNFRITFNSTSGSVQAGRPNIRLWRSADGVNASGAVDLLAGQPSSFIVPSPLIVSGATTFDFIVPLPDMIIWNQYLFVQLAWEITTPGAAAANNVLLRASTTLAITSIVSSNWLDNTRVQRVDVTPRRRSIPPIIKTTNRDFSLARRRSIPPILKTTNRGVNRTRSRTVALVKKTTERSVNAPRRRSATTQGWKTYFRTLTVPRSRTIPPILKTINKKVDLAMWRRQLVILGAIDRYERLNLGFYLSGKMGDIEAHPRLYLSNIYGEELSLLRTVRSASISLNNGRDHLFEMTLGMRATDEFNPLSDFIKPVIDYWNPIEQAYERWPLGVYRVMLPNQSISESSRFWDFTASSYENIVAQDMADKGYAVLPGTKVLAKVRAILMVEFGVPPSMIDFPPDVEDLPILGFRIFDVRDDADGCYWLNIVNTMLSMGGYTKLQATAEGKLRTRKVSNPVARPPDYVLGVGGDNIIDARDAVKSDVDQSEFANVVLVTSNDTLLPPIVARSENHNPNSPSSIENMGNVSIVKHIQLPEFVNASAAKAIADAELARRSGLNEKLTYNTPVDPRRAVPNEIGEINLMHSDESVAIAGRWLVTGWNFSVEPLVSKMENNLTRLAEI